MKQPQLVKLSFLGFLILILLLSGCGTTAGRMAGNPSAAGSQENGAIFTPYPPMPAKSELLAASKEQVRGTETLNLSSGWSTISFPAAEVVSTGSFPYALQYWDGSRYQQVNPASGISPELCKRGFWAMADSATPVIVNASDQAGAGSVTLQAGWNLIGFPQTANISFADLTVTMVSETKSLSQAASLDTVAGSAWVYGVIMYFKNNRWYQLKCDNPGNVLQPWKGYWIFSWTNGINLNFVLPGPVERHWLRTWGGGQWESGCGVAISPDGNLYEVGTATPPDYQSSIYILKYSPQGDLLESRTWKKSAESRDEACSLISDPDGNLYIAGVSDGGALLLKYVWDNGNLTFAWARTWTAGYGAFSDYLALSQDSVYMAVGYNKFGNNDAALLKYSSSGDLQGTRFWGSPGNEWVCGLGIDSQGNIYLPGMSDNYQGKFFLVKYGPELNILFQKGIYQGDWVRNCSIDREGNSYFDGYAYFDGPTYDDYLIKLDSSGNFVWSKRWGTDNMDSVSRILPDQQGNVYVAFSSGNPTLIKYDSGGNLLWQKSFAADIYFTPDALATDNAGNFYLSGAFGSIGAEPVGGWGDFGGQERPDTPITISDISGGTTGLAGTFESPTGIEAFNPPSALGGYWDSILMKFASACSYPYPEVTALRPQSPGWGETVTLTGNNFGSSQGAGRIMISGIDAGQALEWGNNRIIFICPSQIGGQSSLFVIVNMQVNPPFGFTVKEPQINNFTPNYGNSGDQITISGNNFGTEPGSVDIGGLDLEILAWSNTRIEAVIPDPGFSSGDWFYIQVNLPNGQSCVADDFFASPFLEDYLQPYDSRTGSTVTLQGLGLGEERGTVYVNGDAVDDSSVLTWSQTSVTFLMPHTQQEWWSESEAWVETADGKTSNHSCFNYCDAQIIWVDPYHEGFAGERVTITGSGFMLPGADDFDVSAVYFGETPAEIVSVGPDFMGDYCWLICLVPEGVTGDTVLQVELGDGSRVEFPEGFHILEPRIDSIDPPEAYQNDSITLLGSDFGQLDYRDDDIRFYFGDQESDPYGWTNESIQVDVPSGATGEMPIMMMVNGHQVLVYENYPVLENPSIETMEPVSGAPGDTVTLSGVNFGSQTGSLSIYFNDSQAQVVEWTANEIKCLVPDAPAGDYQLYVNKNYQQFSPSSGFTILP